MNRRIFLSISAFLGSFFGFTSAAKNDSKHASPWRSGNVAHILPTVSDSELLVRQMLGRYKVKSPDLRPLHERAQKMARALAHFEIVHVPREQNSEADELARGGWRGNGF